MLKRNETERKQRQKNLRDEEYLLRGFKNFPLISGLSELQIFI